MKVLFIAPQPFFRDRGTPIRTLRQIEELSMMGHHVDIVCYPFGLPIDLPRVRVFRTGRIPGVSDVPIGPSLVKFPMDFLLLLRVFRACLTRRYDVVQAVEESAFFAVWLKRFCGCRLVYNMDSHISDHLRYSGFTRSSLLIRLAAWFEKSAMRAAECVITVGPSLSDVVREAAPGTRVLELEDAPLEDVFMPDTGGAALLRSRLGIADAPVVLYTGNFVKYQGVELLVQSAAHVAKKRPDARFVIVGGEPGRLARLKRIAESLGLGETCIFTGRRPTREMRSFMTMASVLVSPRTMGTNPPLKIYPYMQSERVIVATRLPTHTQVLDDSCAILTEPEPGRIAEGIVLALNDPANARRIAEQAKHRLDAKYSLPIFRSKVRSLYNSIASANGCGVRNPG